MLIDSHAHLTDASLENRVEGMLERAKGAQLDAIINICTNEEELEKSLELEKTYPWVFTAGSTTPHDVAVEGEKAFPAFTKAAKEGKLIAVGETGLDYHYEHSPKELQKRFLRSYLHLALECKLPVIIHCREAFSDFFEILDQEYVVSGRHAPGVLHCFTGTIAEAEEVIKRGWFLSLSGIVTFKKSETLREVAKQVPLQNLVIETDAPYLAPQKYRGEVNEPAYLVETARMIAQCKQISLEEVAKQTSLNAKKVFNLKI